jgi:hypothetical protein
MKLINILDQIISVEATKVVAMLAIVFTICYTAISGIDLNDFAQTIFSLVIGAYFTQKGIEKVSTNNILEE